jgi:aldose sugar dehydrogenase
MRRNVWIASVTVLTVAATLVTRPVPLAAQVRSQGGRLNVSAHLIAENLNNPVVFTFDRHGRIFYGERHTGQIRILDPETGTDRLFFTFPKVFSQSESGLLGIALHPKYPTIPFVYAYSTQLIHGSIWVRVLRIKDLDGRRTASRTLLAFNAHTTDPQHKGGRLLFGPDGMLYVYVGYQKDPANSQKFGNPFGKILRMKPDGTAPKDNPFPNRDRPGNLIWTFGNRNSLGMTFDPWTKRLWLTEGGPDCNDELDLVLKGRNYGWGPRGFDYGTKTPCQTPPPPPKNTNQDGRKPIILPKYFWPTTLTPTGAVFCRHCGLGPRFEGKLLVGNWKYESNPLIPGDIRVFKLNAERNDVVREIIVYTSRKVILSLERGPDGRLYFSDESRIYRLGPA